MYNNLTEIVFILDRSGSMSGLERDTIGGFNSMIQKQKAETEGGDALVTTVLFDHRYEILHDRLEIAKVPEMTEKEYFVRGNTALLDAIGKRIRHIGSIHRYAREEDVPKKTLFVITTDGYENSSRQFTSDEVKNMIRHQKEKYGWEFLFLGANIDAVETARKYGIDEDRAVTYTCDSQGTQLNYRVVGEAVSAMRCSMPLTSKWKKDIEEDHKKRG